ncbi:MAG: ribonuclease domain-containing protein [Gordonia sp. (in: high G+C Gram-positive bacteria)]|uniref:ribonuclease domain-containing protein n=1 Tax=Gordonia sp. (in: high G+C Gram-positive bacteria) TaxID=84139 RepID=UPI0039E5E17C
MSTTPESTSPLRKLLSAAGGIVVLLLVTGLTWWLSADEKPTDATGAAGLSRTASATAPAATPASGTTARSTAPKPSAPSGKPSAKSSASRAAQSPSGQVPQRVLDTLALIDAGDWPDAANAPGTQGGRNFGNHEGLLPRTGAGGKRLRFQEWDVNPKKPNRGRDAERIITANDGSAWYTLDHYRSFKQIRGPSA